MAVSAMRSVNSPAASARLAQPWQCASEGVGSVGCESPQGFRYEPLTESNCVAARRGGEQLEVNDQSVDESYRTRFGQACRGASCQLANP